MAYDHFSDLNLVKPYSNSPSWVQATRFILPVPIKEMVIKITIPQIDKA